MSRTRDLKARQQPFGYAAQQGTLTRIAAATIREPDKLKGLLARVHRHASGAVMPQD